MIWIVTFMAHIDFCLCHSHQVSASYPFSSIGTGIYIDTDAAADTWCGHGLNQCLTLQQNGLCP